MNFQVPHVLVTSRVATKLPVGFDENEGLVLSEVGGEHAIWAARVPFLPSMVSDDFLGKGHQRIPFIMRRQYRFIYDLARARKEDGVTFELRFIASPGTVVGQPNTIDIVFLGKAFSRTLNEARALALQAWELFLNVYPLEEPFNYPLEPIIEEADFRSVYEPIVFYDISCENVLELRKYEDYPRDSRGLMTRAILEDDYLVHPFVPSNDFNPMGRFFAALASQPQRCFAGISLRPARMYDQEVRRLSFAVGRFREDLSEETEAVDEFTRTRAGIGAYLYQQLLQEREQLLDVRVFVVGEEYAPVGLTEALGSEMMGNAQNKYPTQWVTAQPTDDELATALHNLRYLEHDNWGYSQAPPRLSRLRYLCTAQETYGAFRLPVPPESGYMPGVLVKDEPFVSPQDYLEDHTAKAHGEKPSVVLGEIFHRGNPTGQMFSTPIDTLDRHGLVAGSTGSGKSTTIMSLLAQLWEQKTKIPFLVLYPVDKTDYRELLRIPTLAEDLLIFTLAADNAAPFYFNPLAVPEGVLIRTHISRLMRAFRAAFDLWDPLPMIYREALRRAYRNRGWNIAIDVGGSRHSFPDMSDFRTAIEQYTEELEYSGEIRDNIRQASVIRIADLIENVGDMMAPTSQTTSFSALMERPVVLELGRIGSQEDTALVMGFLLIALTETLEKQRRTTPHITIVEEAHRLMASNRSGGDVRDSRSSAGEDFSNILSEIRGYNAGLLIAEQMPNQLVAGAIGNTYLKVMHWLEDSASFNLFSDIMNLTEQQRSYARRLKPGEAIVRSRFGLPVHIKVHQRAELGTTEHSPFDDEWLASTMPDRALRFGLFVEKAEEPTAPPHHADIDPVTIAERIFTAPLGKAACAFCRPLLQTGRCLHGQFMGEFLETDKGRKLAYMAAASIERGDTEDLGPLRRLARTVFLAIDPDGQNQDSISYCLLAHVASPIFMDREPNSVLKDNAVALLRAFPWTEATS